MIEVAGYSRTLQELGMERFPRFEEIVETRFLNLPELRERSRLPGWDGRGAKALEGVGSGINLEYTYTTSCAAACCAW